MDVLKDSGICYTRPCYTRKTEKQWKKNEDAVTTGHHLNEFILFHGFNNINDFFKPTLALKLHPKSTYKKRKPSRSSCWSTAIFLLFLKRPVPQTENSPPDPLWRVRVLTNSGDGLGGIWY